MSLIKELVDEMRKECGRKKSLGPGCTRISRYRSAAGRGVRDGEDAPQAGVEHGQAYAPIHVRGGYLEVVQPMRVMRSARNVYIPRAN
jgi:hypothetical protein